MSSFTSEPKFTLMPDGEFFRVDEAFEYRLGSLESNQFIYIEAGFLTDFASIPKFIRPLLPSWAKNNKPAVLHDKMYREQKIMGEPISRKTAEDIWLEAMLVDFRSHKTGGFIAYLEYTVLRFIGWKAWNDYKKLL